MSPVQAIVTLGVAFLSLLLFTGADEIVATHPEGHGVRVRRLERTRATFGLGMALAALLVWLVIVLAIGGFHSHGSVWYTLASACLAGLAGFWRGYHHRILRVSEHR